LHATGSIENIAFSGDKSVILYSDNIKYLKITGNNQVKLVFEKTGGLGLTLTG